ncbi:MAG TPA: ABC transporter permease [Vicinamibacteria bacterium]|nr:ABC transporter permease [Vicinamibacteria bacterium]
MRTPAWLGEDVRLAVRALRRTPGFSATAASILALAIGGATALFGVVDAVLLRPLPYAQPERLVVLWDTVPRLGLRANLVSPADYEDWTRESRSFASLGGYTEGFANVASDGGGPAERVAWLIASPSFFTTLGVGPALGRGFSPDEGTLGEVIVSHRLWQGRLGGDPRLGELVLDGVRRPVVGVLPPEFTFFGKEFDVFSVAPRRDDASSWRGRRYLTIVGRLAPGVTTAAAQAEMDALAARLAERYPGANAGHGVRVSPLEEEMFGRFRRPLLVLLGATGLVLAIACANVALLQLARGEDRRRELAIRAALGASRWRLIRQLVTESLLLALVAGGLGVGLARLGGAWIVAAAPADVPRLETPSLDGRVLGFALAASVATGLLFGCLPALRAAREGAAATLRQGGRAAAGLGRGRARRALVIGEVALSLVLLAGAGLMVRTLANLLDVDPGFAPEGGLAMDVTLPDAYREPARAAAFFEELAERARALPGVIAAGVTTHLPLSGETGSRPFIVDGDVPLGSEKPLAELRKVSAGYFDAMGIPVRRGRALTRRDGSDAGGVVVNEAFVRHFLGERDPVGRRLVVEDGPPRPREIVGVVADVRHSALARGPQPEMYVSHLDRPWRHMTLVVRGSGEAVALANPLRRELAALDPAVAGANVRTLEQYVSASLATERFSLVLLGGFGASALFLVLIGVNGVTAYAASRRTVELGIRAALGARRHDLLWLVAGDAIRSVLLGLVAGLAGALALGRAMRHLLYDVAPADATTLGVSALLLGALALVACLAPAWSAAGADPLRALRADR